MVLVDDVVEACDKATQRIRWIERNFFMCTIGERTEEARVTKLRHDLVEVREVLLQPDIVPVRLDNTGVLSGKQDERRAKCRRLEDPRRDDVHHDVALPRSEKLLM